jgi:hypothetical protein
MLNTTASMSEAQQLAQLQDKSVKSQQMPHCCTPQHVPDARERHQTLCT